MPSPGWWYFILILLQLKLKRTSQYNDSTMRSAKLELLWGIARQKVQTWREGIIFWAICVWNIRREVWMEAGRYSTSQQSFGVTIDDVTTDYQLALSIYWRSAESAKDDGAITSKHKGCHSSAVVQEKLTSRMLPFFSKESGVLLFGNKVFLWNECRHYLLGFPLSSPILI